MRLFSRAALGGGLIVFCLLALAGAAAAQGLLPTTTGVPLPGKGPRAYVNIIIDDVPNLALWSQLAEDCDKYGMKTTLAVNTAKATPQDYALMAKHIANGHEIADHTRNHVPVAPGGVIKLRYFTPQAKSATAVVEGGATKRLKILVDGSAEPIANLDLSEGGRYQTLKQVMEALNDVRGVTAELGDPYNANIQSRFLADRDKVDIFFKNGLVPLFVDEEAHSTYEMGEGRKDIEAALPGYACDSMVYPFLVTDALTRDVARNLGFKCGRVGTAGYAALGSPAGYDLFQIWAGKPRDLFGTDTASPDFAAKVAAFLKRIKEVGGVCCLYSHGPDEFTNEQWQALLPLLAKDKEVAYVTLRDLGKYVTANAQLKGGKYYLVQGK